MRRPVAGGALLGPAASQSGELITAVSHSH